ncbi:MAG: cytochrome c biogenesis protein ResB [Candidatus Saccharicenans sp.]
MKFLASLKLTIALILILILLSVLGTLLPQNEKPSFYQQHYLGKARLILSLGLDHLYRSPLFLSVSFLFLLNLVACSGQNFLAKVRRLRAENKELNPLSPEDLLLTEKLNQASLIPDDLVSLLRKKSFRVKTKRLDKKTFIYARKGLAGYFGPEIVHAALLLIILGGLGSALFGYRLPLVLSEGEQAELEGKNLTLKLDRFSTEFYPDGSVRDWKSQVTVLENGQVKKSGIIEVNRPLSYKGLNFYQMSYGYDWDRTRLKIQINLGQELISAELNTGESKPVGQDVELKALNFVPDFQVDNYGRVFSRSAEPNNPAVLLELNQGKQVVFSGWVFYLHPDYARFHRKTGEDLKIKLESFSAPEFSVIEAVSDPASNLVWFGCLLLAVGLFISFYFPFRELIITLDAEGHYRALAIARKSRDRFSAEVSDLARQLVKEKSRRK